ncbi:hypothetical protein TNCV_4315261 [Trichonephila clavipes]|nr:hypothetical protein TNCV_4315261 [Trichonephila clavipes]
MEAINYSLYAKPGQSVYITPILRRHQRSSSFLHFHSNIGPPSFSALLSFSPSRALLSSSLDPRQGFSPTPEKNPFKQQGRVHNMLLVPFYWQATKVSLGFPSPICG